MSDFEMSALNASLSAITDRNTSGSRNTSSDESFVQVLNGIGNNSQVSTGNSQFSTGGKNKTLSPLLISDSHSANSSLIATLQ